MLVCRAVPGNGDRIVALPQSAAQPSSLGAAVPESHIRRCTFRRMIAVERRPDAVYDVQCLFPDRSVPIPLGDLESARPICNACTARPVFRPDED
jgi:hypothetical protein